MKKRHGIGNIEISTFETMNVCRLCGGNNILDLGKVNDFTISKCRSCTLVFIREIPNDEYLKKCYTLTSEQEAKMKERSVYLDPDNERNLKYAHKKVADKIKSLSLNK